MRKKIVSWLDAHWDLMLVVGLLLSLMAGQALIIQQIHFESNKIAKSIDGMAQEVALAKEEPYVTKDNCRVKHSSK